MNYSEQEVRLIIANSLKEFNYKQKKLLLASQNKGNANFKKYEDALKAECGESLFNDAVQKLYDGEYRKKTLQQLDKKKIVCVTYKSTLYPEALKNTPAPPLVLYARGNVQLLSEELFGVVGSRKTIPAAYELCKKISAQLSEKFVIVTGVADGADSAAANGALPSGRLICVLPGGHDSSCASNLKVLREAEKNGLTISEFPVGMPARRYTFFLRNRIIAGLCKGVLVASAAKKSGALNTASYAADYSREVFAIPYAPGVTSGEGCNNLIKKGASLCDCAEDILTAFGYEEQATAEVVALDDDEKVVLAIIKDEGEVHVESIMQTTGKALFEVNAICASLEIKGLIARSGGNKYSAL